MPPLVTEITDKAEIKSSPIQGKGLFAVKPIKAGELAVRWGGQYAGRKQAEAAKSQGKLVIQWDEDLYSIEDRGDDEGYFINHSCDSNLWMKGPYDLVARRDIRAGEEITTDYALWEGGDYASAWVCKCGSKFCRGHVTGKDWSQTDVRRRYFGHFSPLINKRIEWLE